MSFSDFGSTLLSNNQKLRSARKDRRVSIKRMKSSSFAPVEGQQLSARQEKELDLQKQQTIIAEIVMVFLIGILACLGIYFWL